MTTQNKISLLLTFAAILLIISCEREWNNPWDEFNNLSPEAWAPQNLQIEDVSITEKKLTWKYGDYNIEGFKIDSRNGLMPYGQKRWIKMDVKVNVEMQKITSTTA